MAIETWSVVYSRVDPSKTCTVYADVNVNNGNLSSLSVVNQITGAPGSPERVVARIIWGTGQAPTVVDPVPVGTHTMPKGQAQKATDAAQWSLTLVRG